MLGILRKVRSFLVLLAAGQVSSVWEELKSYLERRVRWRFFRKSVTFTPLTPETRLPFETG